MHLDYQQLTLLKQIHPNIRLCTANEIPIVVIEHEIGKAAVALQGAQLLSWQPHFAEQDILWLSNTEPFNKNVAIRGGIPICYPWFGQHDKPAHGYARISMWQLSSWQVDEKKVSLVFYLYDKDNIVEAKLNINLSDVCHLCFTHYGNEPAELALHSYFNIGDIAQTTLFGLPHSAYDNLSKQDTHVQSPLQFNQECDAIFSAEQHISHIDDKMQQRIIEVEHINASDIVVWNPWQNTPSQMNSEGYRTMLCVETARIRQPLLQKESVETIIRLQR